MLGFGSVDQQLDRLGHLAQVVRRDVGGHADRDARRPVDQQVRDLGRKDRRLLQPVVEVGLEVDRVLVDVLQHGHRDPGEPGLGVAVGRRRVAVDRAEVPLAVHQRIAEREVLHHPHERVVDRAVTVRVVLAEHVAHHRRRLLVRPAGHEPQLVHRVQDPAVHRLEAVPDVGQRPRHDDAHRVVDERLLHLLFDEPGQNTFARIRCGHVGRGLGESSRPGGRAETPKYTPEGMRNATVEVGWKSDDKELRERRGRERTERTERDVPSLQRCRPCPLRPLRPLTPSRPLALLPTADTAPADPASACPRPGGGPGWRPGPSVRPRSARPWHTCRSRDTRPRR